jgi:ATP-dependent DNA ligase
MYPPRPKHKIRPSDLAKYEAQGIYVVQRKFNGTRTTIHVEGGNITTWTRHNTPHKQWELTEDVANQIRSLNIKADSEYWFDAELLNNKTTTPHYKNRVVLFDVLHAGRYLFGKPNLLGRYDILSEICGHPQDLEPQGIALRVTENIWLAETFHENFEERFKDFIEMDEIEGLVLKKAKSALDNFGVKEYEIGWQLRCRKEHKNYNW